ncbi:zinc-binding dehydrogenase [Okeania sp. SIO2B3]|uniref:zinc-binding dehydrogenase n=1 Tax=Okeania sp. SIO2B3 TaxID=2607784 RepID=UPI0013BEECB7|nr:zinc-binding dehydrogenase [Okeania sp. SIO2B3]NET45757.1 zinc-binding dehydrogenase [Okeania sp. SIO2B3]
MKALVLDQPGIPNSLHIAEMPLPQPEVDEIRVKVHAVGLNPVDYKVAASGFSRWNYPFILGLDVAGVVDAVGANVTDWQVGDKVYYHGNLSKPGGYAEYTNATAIAVAPLPEGVSFTEAAAIPCAGLTAYQALHRRLHIQSEQTILIHGGAGGVGSFGIQLAVLTGLEVITTCSQNNFDYVQQLGAKHLIDYKNEDVVVRVKEITKGRGVDAILDTVSSETATKGFEMLAFNGGIACIAGLPDFSKFKPFSIAASIHEVALGGAYLSGDKKAIKDLGKMAREMGELVRQKKVNSMSTEVISLEEIPEALNRLKGRHVRGKIVAKVEG